MSTASRKRKQIKRINDRNPCGSNFIMKWCKGQRKMRWDFKQGYGPFGEIFQPIGFAFSPISEGIKQMNNWAIQSLALPSELIKPTEKFWGDLADEQLEADKMDTWREERKLRLLKEILMAVKTIKTLNLGE